MQAYLSGCPRFTLSASDDTKVRLTSEPFPTHRGNLQDTIRDIIQYLRRLADVTGIEGDAYDSATRIYYVTIDGEGQVASEATPVYDSGGVRVYRAGDAPR